MLNGTENQTSAQIAQKRKNDISNSKTKRNYYEAEDFAREWNLP